MSEREIILKVRHLKHHFKSGIGKNKIVVKAVDDISFDVYKGEVFSLVGESGCGKTTTGRAIIKLYDATGGDVYFHGEHIISDVAVAREVYKNSIKSLADEYKLSIENLEKNISYEQEKAKIDKQYDAQKKALKKVYIKAKRDRKYENQKDDAYRGKIAALNEESPEIVKINNRYKKIFTALEIQLKEIDEKINGINLSDGEDLKELKKEKRELGKQYAYNKRNKVKDLRFVNYNIKHRNRFLLRNMQMIFQDPVASLNPRMTVKELIAEGLRINGLKNESEINRRVKEALKIVGLVPEHASRYPHEFSGGQRQRIGIARVLIVDPAFIIADEPISNLDVSVRAQIINLLNDLREATGITIMFIAHDLSVVKYFSDRVAVMYFGKIVEMGDKDKIFNNPFHPYTLSLIDSIPLPDPNYEKMRKKKPRYNRLTEHDYSKEQPKMREIEPGHFVLCNTEEFNRYKERLQ